MQVKLKTVVKEIIVFAFIIQAVIIGIRGNINVLSGMPPLDVIQSMIAQGVELILKAHNAEKRLDKKNDRTFSPSE